MSEFCKMNELPAIRSLFMRKGFWDRQGANIASRREKMYSGNFLRRSKNYYRERYTVFSTLFYQKSIWAILIRGKCKFLFE